MMENYYGRPTRNLWNASQHFAFDEVVNEPGQELDPVTRHMAISGHPAGLPRHRCLPGSCCPPPWRPE